MVNVALSLASLQTAQLDLLQFLNEKLDHNEHVNMCLYTETLSAVQTTNYQLEALAKMEVK